MHRIFLGRSCPACLAVADRLLQTPDDLPDSLVLVPTQEAARQLKQQLAIRSKNQAVFAPQIAAIERIVQPETGEHVADPIATLAAWESVLKGGLNGKYGNAFPVEITDDMPNRLALAQELRQLFAGLGRHGVETRQISRSIAELGQSKEAERWQDLVALFAAYRKQLSVWGLTDPATCTPQANDALLPGAPAPHGKVIVACVPELSAPVRHILDSWHKQYPDVDIEIWIHSPESEKDMFDSWGMPGEQWATRNNPVTDKQITLVADTERLARETCRQIAEITGDGVPNIALGVCDTDDIPTLAALFEQDGWQLHNPQGRALAGTGAVVLLRHVQQALSPQRGAKELYPLFHSALLCHSLGLVEQQTVCCEILDKIQQNHLPTTIQDVFAALDYAAADPGTKSQTRERIPQVKEFVQTILAWLDQLSAPRDFAQHLLAWIETLPFDRTETEVQQQLIAAVQALAQLQTRLSASGALLPVQDAMELLLQSLANTRSKKERPQGKVLEALGWLEIQFRPETDILLLDLNEGKVPEGNLADQFIPESLRGKLGMPTLYQKTARDNFLLTALIESRAKEKGKVHVILSKLNSRNEPNTPSSLLMRCSDEELPERVNKLFNEPPQSHVISYERAGWRWQLNSQELPRGEQPVERRFPRFVNPYKEGKHGFSPSALKRFLECPLRFWIGLAQDIRGDEAVLNKEAMNAAERGTLMHAVLKEFCEQYPKENDRLQVEQMQRDIVDLLEKQFAALYPTPLVPLILQKQALAKCLKQFAELHYADLKDGWECLEREYRITDWRLEGFPVTGIVDRIDYNPETDQYRIIDYKTKKIKCEANHTATVEANSDLSFLSPALNPMPPEGKTRKDRRWTDLQLPLYVLWAQEHYGTQNVQAAYYCLPAKLADIRLEPWENLYAPRGKNDKTTLDYAREWALEIMRLITAGQGLISAEELGWPVSPYSPLNQVMDSRHESLGDVLHSTNH